MINRITMKICREGNKKILSNNVNNGYSMTQEYKTLRRFLQENYRHG